MLTSRSSIQNISSKAYSIVVPRCFFEYGEKFDEVLKRRCTAKKAISLFVMRNPSRDSADIIAHWLLMGKVPTVYRLQTASDEAVFYCESNEVLPFTCYARKKQLFFQKLKKSRFKDFMKEHLYGFSKLLFRCFRYQGQRRAKQYYILFTSPVYLDCILHFFYRSFSQSWVFSRCLSFSRRFIARASLIHTTAKIIPKIIKPNPKMPVTTDGKYNNIQTTTMIQKSVLSIVFLSPLR